jgi:hypothetical protein
MTEFLTNTNAWVTATFLAAAMLSGWGVGWWWGQRLAKDKRGTPAHKLSDASLAVLGLLLAFTFSMALAKHEERRKMVITDSNSIGDFYTCASLLKEPVRSKLRSTVHSYVRHRLTLAKTPLEGPELEKRLAEVHGMHDQIQALVAQALHDGTSIAVSLVNTFNEVTSSHAARMAATRDRLPVSILLLLFTGAVLCMALIGAQQGATGERHLGATIAFVTIVCLVVWVTLDLNQPQPSVITVSQEPIQRLLTEMGD